MEEEKKRTLLFELPMWRSDSKAADSHVAGPGTWVESKEVQMIRDNILRFWSALERNRNQRRLHDRHLPVP